MSSFMAGYVRDPKTTDRLVEALRVALYTHPEQRLGQLLLNLANDRDLWNVYDETWIALLDP